MSNLLPIISATAAVVAAFFAGLAFLRTGRAQFPERLTKEIVAQIVRSECEILRRAGDDQARGLRQELIDTLKSFQEGTLSGVGTLSEFIRSQIRDFGERLDIGMKQVDERVGAISAKLNDDLGKMSVEAHGNRDALRQIVESKLDDSIEKHVASATELRKELGSSFRDLGSRVAETLEKSSEQQQERLDKTATALKELGEKQEQAQEKLRYVVEGRLDAIRTENASKLDEMRQTVDEKLQSTLETRLGESFNRVVEQLKSVHEGIGEMKKLAANVGDLQKVLTNVKVRGTYGEVQLAILLEEFLSPDQYVKDAVVKENSSEHVEYAIRLPGRDSGGEVLLPVDAKFPREDYEKLIAASEAGDTKLVAFFRKQLENRIKSCAKDIRDKYVNPPRTTDFGILFIPTESLYVIYPYREPIRGNSEAARTFRERPKGIPRHFGQSNNIFCIVECAANGFPIAGDREKVQRSLAGVGCR